MLRATALTLLIILAMPLGGLAADRSTLVRGELTVVFDEPERGLAKEVFVAYPAVKAELEEAFGRKADFRRGVTAVLLSEDDFRNVVGASPIVAFASGGKNKIVIGASRARRDAERFDATLKHELAHLFLASYIKGKNIPRWLNEGVSQWVSGGISELLMVGSTSELERAILFGRLIPLDDLSLGFPQDEKGMRLAYQESLSFVEFVVEERGRDGLMGVLDRLSDGDSIGDAFRHGAGAGLPELERQWHERLRVRHTFLTYLSNNIYTLLFSFAALITVYGFIRLILRMRAYRDEDEEEGG